LLTPLTASLQSEFSFLDPLNLLKGGLGFQVAGVGAGSRIKKPLPNPTCCHS